MPLISNLRKTAMELLWPVSKSLLKLSSPKPSSMSNWITPSKFKLVRIVKLNLNKL